MAKQTKVDLARQAKILGGERATFEGGMEIKSEFTTRDRVFMHGLGATGSGLHVMMVDYTGLVQLANKSDFEGEPGPPLNFKGEVDLINQLPTTGNVVGDAWLVRENGYLYVWNGTEWIGTKITSQSVFTSVVFKYFDEGQTVVKPTGGNFLQPIPSGWSDSVPQQTTNGSSLYMSSRLFTSDGKTPQTASWSEPAYMGDTDVMDVQWSLMEGFPGNPNDFPQNWEDDPVVDAVWMGVRLKVNAVWGNWTITKIKGEKGEVGVSIFKSIVFIRSNAEPTRPTGGSYSNPVPSGWSDGIPTGEERVWTSSRTFTSNGDTPQDPQWTAPTPITDTSTIDFEFSSVDNDPGNPTTHPQNWHDGTVATPNDKWMAQRVKTNGVWSDWTILRIQGEKGENGSGYDFNYYVTNVGDPAPNINGTVGWTTTIPTLTSTQTLWMRSRQAFTDGTYGAWQGPVKMSGDDGTARHGASLAYRGDWSSVKQYQGSEWVVDVVKYNVSDKAYIAKTIAGTIPVGTLPTDTTYWTEVEMNIDSVFTDYLIAYNAYIEDLTVGSIKTATEGSRIEINKGENKLKFFKGTETTPLLTIGTETTTGWSGGGGGIIVGPGGSNSTTYNATGIIVKKNFLTSDGVGIYGGLGFAHPYRDEHFRIHGSGPINDGYLSHYGLGCFIQSYPLVNKPTNGTFGNYYGVVTNSIYIRPMDTFNLNEGIFVGNANTSIGYEEPPARGYTGTINGARFVHGICVGPA